MYIGTQVAPRNLSDLEVWSQLGVKNICTDPFKENDEGEFSSINPHEWTEEILEKHVEIIEKNGLKLDITILQDPTVLLFQSIIVTRQSGIMIQLGFLYWIQITLSFIVWVGAEINVLHLKMIT